MPAKKWTKQKVIEAIRERQRLGLSMSSVWRDDSSLYAAAKKHFGSWRGAILALGVPGARPLRRWTKQRVIDAILTRHQRGLSLSKTWKEDRILYDAAHRRFKSWHRAVVSAGIEPARPAQRKWTKQLVLEAIRARKNQGLPMTGITKRDPALGAAALRLFGSYELALAAAGLERPQHGWSKQRIVEAIQDRYVKGLSLKGPEARLDPELVSAAKRKFRSWRKALSAAGIPQRAPEVAKKQSVNSAER